MADEAIIEPTRERRRHGGIERVDKTIQDSNGAIGLPFRFIDTLTRMEGHGRISPTMKQAGDHFHDLFRRAGCLDGLYSSDPRRIPVLTVDSSARAWVRTISDDAAYWVIRTSLDALGGPAALAGSCAWHVLGLEQSLKEWCQIYQWGHWRGARQTRLDVPTASGVLMTTLNILELHYRFVTP